MSAFNPYQPPVDHSSYFPDDPPSRAEPVSLGGWLIFVGIGIIWSLSSMCMRLAISIQTLFLDGMWAVMTAPGGHNRAYVLTSASIDLAVRVISVVVWGYLLYLYFRKKKAFSRWYVGAHLGVLLYPLIGALAFHWIRPDLPLVHPQVVEEILRKMFPICVWVPYLLGSKRVKATFIR